MHMEPDETPRQLGEDDELPDDLGSRVDDTLTFGGSGSTIRTVSTDDAHRRLAPPKLTDLDASEIDRASAFAEGDITATGERQPEPGSVLDSRPKQRGLNRLVPTGRRRAARKHAPAPSLPVGVPSGWLTVELVRMIALCPACHQVKHLGFASVKGKSAQARAHLARVNGWTLAQADAYIGEAFRVWAQRSQGPWTLDLDGLRPYVLGGEYLRIVRQAAIPPERRRMIGS